ncbi:MAG: hypothetical protein MUP81_06580 [Dehalococcoidia bacterium]|nr:hypothetical protein [Dehalococcoidia bacterium]
MKTNFILLVILILVLSVLPLGCESINRVENAESCLKQALDQIGDMRQAIWNDEYITDLDFQLEDIEKNIEDALQELYYTHPNY